ncbi:MAG: chemotaxis protein CheW [Bacteroidia bacterium]|nr:chemotaxis protein CheW [Bacteroidia bacterium]MCZ2356539.1 chemotaxis protein CheW [Bacteroidia bacterium]
MDTYLTFVLGEECFAVSVSNVLEVFQKQPVTKIPRTPEHILGIINFRGEILPVVDTRCKFSLPASPEDKHIVIVFETNTIPKLTIAATADAVQGVIDISSEEIKPVPELGLSYNVTFIQGAVRKDETFILMLNIDKVFSAKDLAVVQEIQPTEEQTQH